MQNYIKSLDTLKGRAKMLLEHLEHLYDISDTDQRNLLLIQTSLDGELLAKNLRKLLIESSIATKDSLYHQICTMNGYDVTVEGDTTVITMPPLPLKERGYANYSYFVDPLLSCFEEYAEKNEIRKYDRCILCIKHIFPEDTPLRQLHDYDNLEVKKVLDAVSLFFLTDDNIRKCQVHHIGEVGESMRTEIWIFPLCDGDKNASKT